MISKSSSPSSVLRPGMEYNPSVFTGLASASLLCESLYINCAELIVRTFNFVLLYKSLFCLYFVSIKGWMG